MAETLNEKGPLPPPQLTITTENVTEPEKAFDGTSTRPPSSHRPSHEHLRREDSTTACSSPRSYHGANPFDTDVEAMVPHITSSREEICPRKSSNVARGASDCQVWPGQDHWRQRAKAAKMNNRSCTCMARLSKRTRILVKILIALLVVGIAVGVGVGISKPLGAPIWGRPNNQNNQRK